MITIDRFMDEDYNTLVSIYNETTKELNWSEFNDEQKEVVLMIDSDKPKILKLYQENITLVARENGKALGFICIDRNTGMMYHFYVIPQMVGKGIGRQLYEKAEYLAKKLSLKSIFLHTSQYAMPIYERFGFKDMGIDSWAIECSDGTKVVFNDHKMEKIL